MGCGVPSEADHGGHSPLALHTRPRWERVLAFSRCPCPGRLRNASLDYWRDQYYALCKLVARLRVGDRSDLGRPKAHDGCFEFDYPRQRRRELAAGGPDGLSPTMRPRIGH